ncbi:MAG: class E sortase [Actinobacteria bacterium]|nr:class E sortase [Actinomycetota bacterium]
MSHSARWKRAASNAMLGIALGLLSYYTLTTLLTGLAQRDLRGEHADVAAFAAENPFKRLAPPPAGEPLDFEGWESEDLPYWASLPEGEVFGRIVIESITLDALIIKGVRPQDLRRGPGWIDYSNVPGPTGNCGISGHRTTYGAPFRRIDELQPGDTIDLYSPYRMYRYEVARTLIVRPDQVEVVAFTESPTLTLTACHPPYSARSRIIVQADLVEVRRVEDEAE